MRPLHRSSKAIDDINACLEWSLDKFGRLATERYAELLSVSLEEICNDPFTIGSEPFPEMGEIRLIHTKHFRKLAPVVGLIVKNPRHFLVYQELDNKIFLVRILHDNMELEKHV